MSAQNADGQPHEFAKVQAGDFPIPQMHSVPRFGPCFQGPPEVNHLPSTEVVAAPSRRIDTTKSCPSSPPYPVPLRHKQPCRLNMLGAGLICPAAFEYYRYKGGVLRAMALVFDYN